MANDCGFMKGGVPLGQRILDLFQKDKVGPIVPVEKVEVQVDRQASDKY